jgi:hypothetical protein
VIRVSAAASREAVGTPATSEQAFRGQVIITRCMLHAVSASMCEDLQRAPSIIVTLLAFRAWAQPATLAGFSDQGSFALFVNEERIGRLIPPGHRMRVEVSSSAFPLFKRNLNTGGSNETGTHFVSADQTIYHDARHPSHILLPMIPEK